LPILEPAPAKAAASQTALAAVQTA
jgi:hypothetical protein